MKQTDETQQGPKPRPFENPDIIDQIAQLRKKWKIMDIDGKIQSVSGLFLKVRGMDKEMTESGFSESLYEAIKDIAEITRGFIEVLVGSGKLFQVRTPLPIPEQPIKKEEFRPPEGKIVTQKPKPEDDKPKPKPAPKKSPERKILLEAQADEIAKTLRTNWDSMGLLEKIKLTGQAVALEKALEDPEKRQGDPVHNALSTISALSGKDFTEIEHLYILADLLNPSLEKMLDDGFLGMEEAEDIAEIKKSRGIHAARQFINELFSLLTQCAKGGPKINGQTFRQIMKPDDIATKQRLAIREKAINSLKPDTWYTLDPHSAFAAGKMELEGRLFKLIPYNTPDYDNRCDNLGKKPEAILFITKGGSFVCLDYRAVMPAK